MLSSPRLAFANAVLFCTNLGGCVASLEAKRNLKVHVALHFDFDTKLDESEVQAI